MLVYAVALATLQPAVPQEPVDGAATVSAVEMLAGLTDKVNSLAGFRATYSLIRPGDEDRSIELYYDAPDRMRLDMGGAETGNIMQMWSVDYRMVMLGGAPGGERNWAAFDYHQLEETRPAALDALERLFPPDEAPLGPGPTIETSWRLDPKTDKVDFELSLSWMLQRRAAPVGWLRTLKREPDLLGVEPQAVVQEHERYRAEVSRVTGFLDVLEMVGADGVTATLRLEALDREPEWEAGLFEAPRRPEGATDISANFEQGVQAMHHPLAVRRECLLWVDRQLERGDLEWTTSTKDGCEEVLRTLHEPLLRGAGERYVESTAEFVDQLGEWLRRARARGESVETLRAQVAEKREQVETNLAKSMNANLEKLQSASLGTDRFSDHWDGILAIERAAYAELYEEHYLRPALEELDAAVDEALGG